MGVMKKLILMGMVTVALMNVPLPYITNRWLLIGLLFIGGIGSGLVLPLSEYHDYLCRRKRRTWNCHFFIWKHSLFRGSGGPPIFGKLVDHKFILFWGLAGFCLLLVFFAATFIHRPNFVRGKRGHSRTILRPIPEIQKEPI